MVAVGFMIGLAKGGFSGIGAVVTPLVSLALSDVALALGLLLPMLLAGDAFAVYTYWRQWDNALLWRLLPGALVGMALGLFVLVSLPAKTMRLALGVFTLSVVVYKIATDAIRRLRYQPRPWHGPLAGTLTGIASTLFNAGGAPFNAYLLLNKIPPRPFVATTAIFFAILNASKIPGFVAAGVFDWPLVASLWWVFLLIPLGLGAAKLIIARTDPRWFERVILGLTVISGTLLVWQGL